MRVTQSCFKNTYIVYQLIFIIIMYYVQQILSTLELGEKAFRLCIVLRCTHPKLCQHFNFQLMKHIPLNARADDEALALNRVPLIAR
jgi:hypothetical protein